MKTHITVLLGIAWITAVTTGMGWLYAHGNTPGAPATAPRQLPRDSRIQFDPDRPSLVMLAHPRCPCTRASLGELARIMAICHGQVSAYVLFVKPAGTGADWANTDLREAALAIPDVHVATDDNNLISRQLGSQTSGQVLLYDKQGRLIFSGGITSSRGHAGDNAGSEAIISLLRGRSASPSTLVFGCPLNTALETPSHAPAPCPANGGVAWLR